MLGRAFYDGNSISVVSCLRFFYLLRKMLRFLRAWKVLSLWGVVELFAVDDDPIAQLPFEVPPSKLKDS